MLKTLIKWTATASLMAALAFAAAASSPSHVAASNTDACVRLSSGFTPGSVRPGARVVAHGRVDSCSTSTQTLRMVLEISGPCYVGRTMQQDVTLAPNEHPSGSMPFTAPACPGVYRATVKAYSGSQLIDTTTSTFRVR